VDHFFRAFRHRNYRLFFGGQLISLVGTWMQQVAQAWLVYRLTHSSALLGLVSFAGQIPVFVLGPLGGTAADRVNRHTIIVWTQTASMALAFVLAALTLTGAVRVWQLLFLAGLLGVVNAFDIPARQAFMINMVGREDLMNAIALNSSMVNGARVIGPAIAGAVVAAVGEGWCFLLNGLSYIAVIAGLLFMSVTRARGLARAGGSAIADIVEGFRFVGMTVPVRTLLLLVGIVSLTGMPYGVLMPIFADQILHGGPASLGLLMGASGIGALAGALGLAMRRGIRGLGSLVAISTLTLGVALLLFAWSRRFWISAALLVPVGGSMIVQMAASNTLIQAMVPNRLRGRVMSVYTMMFTGMAPFGALLAGWLAVPIGAPGAVTAGAIVCIAAAITFRLELPSLRGEARALIVAQELAGGDPVQEVTGPADQVPLEEDMALVSRDS
jgi:MFS family permease